MENDNVQLTLQDLTVLRDVVSVACTRGAFKADEMSTVGATYDRLNAFLESMKPLIETGDAENGTASDQTTGENHD